MGGTLAKPITTRTRRAWTSLRSNLRTVTVARMQRSEIRGRKSDLHKMEMQLEALAEPR